MDRSGITSLGVDPEVLRTDPAYRKIMRAGLFKHHIDEMRQFGARGRYLINIHSNQFPIFVIGDNPILFRKAPKEFSKFGETDFLFPLSSRRIYTSTQKAFSLTKNTPVLINAAMIDQSKCYIACYNKDVLEASVNLYKQLKEKWMLYDLPKFLFDPESGS